MLEEELAEEIAERRPPPRRDWSRWGRLEHPVPEPEPCPSRTR